MLPQTRNGPCTRPVCCHRQEMVHVSGPYVVIDKKQSISHARMLRHEVVHVLGPYVVIDKKWSMSQASMLPQTRSGPCLRPIYYHRQEVVLVSGPYIIIDKKWSLSQARMLSFLRNGPCLAPVFYHRQDACSHVLLYLLCNVVTLYRRLLFLFTVSIARTGPLLASFKELNLFFPQQNSSTFFRC